MALAATLFLLIGLGLAAPALAGAETHALRAGEQLGPGQVRNFGY